MLTTRMILGDSHEVLPTLEPQSFDALVTGPPAGISFMGEAWDSYESLTHFERDMTAVFKKALRCLKPGAHGLVWAIPRTVRYIDRALADAGFEKRDEVVHLFSQGMPKGLNVAKAGAGPEWEGWNTTLKPAHEYWLLVRRPLAQANVVEQVRETGTGAINAGACLVPYRDAADLAGSVRRNPGRTDLATTSVYGAGRPQQLVNTQGRYPMNAMLSHSEHCDDETCVQGCVVARLGDEARYFFAPKISRTERMLPDGTTNPHPTVQSVGLMRYLVRLVTREGGSVLDPFAGTGSTGVAAREESRAFVGIERDPNYHRIAQLRLNLSAPTVTRAPERYDVVSAVLNGEFE